MKSLARFSVDQGVLVNILFFVCLLGGLAAMSRVPVEFFPDVNLNEVQITTLWTGASAEEVERLVTQKVEEELLAVTDITEVHSVSQANVSTIYIDFDEYLQEVGYEAAVNDVRAAIDRVRDLPEDAEESILTEIRLSEVSPAVLVAVVDSGNVGSMALREVARDLKKRLRDLQGANSIKIRGDQEREVRVLVDRDAAARHGLSVLEISDRIRRNNLNLPAGTFETPGGEFTLRARGDFEGVEDLAETVVSETDDGTLVRLAEVARVEEGLEKPSIYTRFNAQEALVVSVHKKTGADTIRLVRDLDAFLEGYRNRLPAGVEVVKTVDTARYVGKRMGILWDNLVAGILFVAAILWFTLGFRNAMLTVIAIPFSFLTAMIFFPFLGLTINSTTVIAMLLVSGMLVDDAIIVLENIYRRIETGQSLREAVIEGTEEVMWPVICAVATTVAAFSPLLLVGGTAGKFVSPVPKAVVACLIASLFECLLILPAHYIDFGSRRRLARETGPAGATATTPGVRSLAFVHVFREGVDGRIARLREAYLSGLDRALAHRAPVCALFFALLMLAGAGFQHLRVDLFPGEFDNLNIRLETPSNTPLETTDDVARGIDAVLNRFVGDEIKDFSTTVGLSVDTNYDSIVGANYAMGRMTLSDTPENTLAPERALFAMQERLSAYAKDHPDEIVELRVQAQQDGPPLGAPIEVRLQAEDYGVAKMIAEEIRSFLETLPGVYNIEDNLRAGAPEVRLHVDEERANRHGLRFEDLARALRAANDGVVASSLRESARSEDVDIRVRLDDRYRKDLQDLLDIEIPTSKGYLVRLRDVATVDVTRGYRAFHRYDGKRTVSVFAQVDEVMETAQTANRKLQAEFADLEQRYPEVRVRYGGEFAESNEAFASLFAVTPVALVAIYMILAALFRNYLQPVIVLSAIPFGFMGIVLGIALFDYSLSFVLVYASIGLTGVIVNDSLVMVDFINRARREGMELLEAVRLSGARRFRPILLTTLTTVTALLPMAVGLQGSSKTYGPFAASISFGMIVAMVGTLFAVPVVYTVLVHGQASLARGWERRNQFARQLAESVPDRFRRRG
ncbi:MAG: efflux RND transporter permease subunit [bacterium]|nr:efflux RND transporter permease subunit [bacterium]